MLRDEEVKAEVVVKPVADRSKGFSELQTFNPQQAIARAKGSVWELLCFGPHDVELLSTAVRSGVLRPAAAASGLQTVFGTNIEDDLREVAAQESAKPRKFRSDIIPRKSPANAPPKGGSAVPAFGIGSAKYQRSLQSSAPYDAEREQKQLERAVDAAIASQYHRTTFVTRKAVTAPAPPTLLSESEYVPAKLQTLKKR